MEFVASWRLKNASIVPIISVLVLAIAVGGPLIGSGAIGFRELAILILSAVTLLVILISNEKAIRLAGYVAVLSFGIGMRELHLGSFSVHPAEILFWLLFLLIGLRVIIQRRTTHFALIFPVRFFLLFAILGIPVGLSYGTDLVVLLREFKLVLVLLPVMYVATVLGSDEETWARLMAVMFFAAVYIAFLACLEYFFPATVQPFRGFFGESPFLDAPEGFTRARFSFWGNPLASAYLAWMLPIGLVFAQRSKSRVFFLFYLIGCGLLLMGIYISAQRGAWLAVGSSLLVLALFNGRRWWLLMGAGVVLAVVFSQYLPLEFYTRLQTLSFDPSMWDNTQQSRFDRNLIALDLILSSPVFGNGWAASGWVHNDLVQIAANIGIPAMICLVVYYLSVILNLFRASAMQSCGDSQRRFAYALAASLIGNSAIMVTQPVIVMAPLIVPLWFLGGMSISLVESVKGRGQIVRRG